MKLISVIVPVHNEEANLEEFHRRVSAALVELTYTHELIFIDDGSRDGTLAKLDELCERDPAVRYLSFSRNFGHQSALTAGLDHAAGDAVICMDGDLQHPPELLPKLVAEWEQGYQIVNTIRRRTEGVSLFKRVTAAGFYGLINRMSNVKIEPNSSDFRLMDKRVAVVLRDHRERERFYRGMVRWVGFRQQSVEFEAGSRFAGEPSYTPKRMMRFALDGLLSYSYIPIVFVVGVSFLLILAAFLYIVLVLYQKFVSGEAIPGQTSVLMSILIIGTTQLLATTVTAIYAYKCYQEVKGRPLYIVSTSKGFP